MEDATESQVKLDTSNGNAMLKLTAKLDKEELEGPASINLNIECEKLGTNDPSFNIPVSIRFVYFFRLIEG